jgi:hypothetical protein
MIDSNTETLSEGATNKILNLSGVENVEQKLEIVGEALHKEEIIIPDDDGKEKVDPRFIPAMKHILYEIIVDEDSEEIIQGLIQDPKFPPGIELQIEDHIETMGLPSSELLKDKIAEFVNERE